MTRQAENALSLYYDGDPFMIDKLLKCQRPILVKELMEHFHCCREELPLRLSIGK